MLTVKETLMEARRLIKDVGWFKGAYEAWSSDGKDILAYCSVGAIRKAYHQNDENANDLKSDNWTIFVQATNFFKEVIVGSKGHAVTEIAAWNDNPTRTKSEVLSTFDQAIELASKEENK